jgi:hypothetical protein
VAAIRSLCFILLLLFLLESRSLAESSMELVGNVLLQEGHGGKQVYDGSGDQQLTLFEPTWFIDTQLSPETSLHGSVVYDTWTSASERIFDTSTGASGGGLTGTGGGGDGEDEEDDGEDQGGGGGTKYESRGGFDLGVSHKMGTWVVSPSLGYSSESDYVSQHGGIGLQKSFAEDNFTLAAGYFYYGDRVNVFDLAALKFTGWTPRITQSATLSASQILGPLDVILLGTSFTRQAGYLSGNRNTVAFAGARSSEVLPDLRNKITGTARWVHGFTPELALHLDYRYYQDDWNLRSHTVEPSLAVSWNEDAELLRLAYRYYRQNAVRYFAGSFSSLPQFRTQDSDLEDFYAQEVRLHFSHRWDVEGWFQELALGATALYYTRSNDLRAVLLQLGISGVF